VIPAGADKAVFLIAPLISFVVAVIAWAVIPFNDTWVLADINVAILYVLAISSLGVYGIIMGAGRRTRSTRSWGASGRPRR
jgi:NADH-quinone oxidoreductase subunit H